MAMPNYLPDIVELRCAGTLHGILKDGLLEVKCHHIRCTKGRDVNVFHYYDSMTGDLVETKMFQDPSRRFK